MGKADASGVLHPEFVSGSYGKRGFFEGPFTSHTPTQALVNRFHVSSSDPSGNGNEMETLSTAGIVAYNADFTDVLSEVTWATGSSSAPMQMETTGVVVSSVENCTVLTGAEKMHALATVCMIPQREAVDADWAGSCKDMEGFKDSRGNDCGSYALKPSKCEGSPEDGVYDPPSLYADKDGFDASQACCACQQSSLPFAGSSWIRYGVAPEPISEPMGEISFCSQGMNPLVPHSLRELTTSCTQRMRDEKRCPLTSYDNRSIASDSLIFAGSSIGVLGVAGSYSGSNGEGHMILVLAGPHTMKGFTCAYEMGSNGYDFRCTFVEFHLHEFRRACQPTIMEACKLRNHDNTLMTWTDLRPMRAEKNFYTGGLGDLARKSKKASYGVWACVKNWDEVQQLYCASGPERLVCFQYEDNSQKFEFWGHNSDLRLVETSQATFV